jgi:hypothetical protein
MLASAQPGGFAVILTDSTEQETTETEETKR